MTLAAPVPPRVVHPVWHLLKARDASFTRRLRTRDIIGLSSLFCFALGFGTCVVTGIVFHNPDPFAPLLFLPLMWHLLVLQVTLKTMRCLWRRPDGET